MKLGKLVAFTGTHGVGKTTSTFKKAHELKIKHKDKKVGVLIESTHDCPFPINGDTSSVSQIWMFSNHLNNELSSLSKFDIVVSDRTLFDYIAYTIWIGEKELSNEMLSISKHNLKFYHEIYFKTINKNDYLYADNHRDVDNKSFRNGIEDILMDIYKKLGIVHDCSILKFE